MHIGNIVFRCVFIKTNNLTALTYGIYVSCQHKGNQFIVIIVYYLDFLMLVTVSN